MLRNYESDTRFCHKVDTQKHEDSRILRNSGITEVSSPSIWLRRNRLTGITLLPSLLFPSQKVSQRRKKENRKRRKKKKRGGEGGKGKGDYPKKNSGQYPDRLLTPFLLSTAEVTKCWDFLPR